MTLSLGLAVIFNIQQTLTVIIRQLGFSKYHVEPSYMNDIDYHDFCKCCSKFIHNSRDRFLFLRYIIFRHLAETEKQVSRQIDYKTKQALPKQCKENSNMTDKNYHYTTVQTNLCWFSALSHIARIC
jgi:hypothetical protein